MVMMREYGIAPQDIERIDFGSNPSCGLISKFAAPKLSNQAKYSSPYIIAVAVLDGALGPEQFFDERVTRPDVQAMARRVTVYVHDDLKDSLPKDYCKGHVRIALKSGRVHERWFEEAKGWPGLPYAREELRERFFACAKHGLPQSDLAGAYAAVAGLAEAKTVDPLMAFIRGASR
jgi:2-methylcitrate dehydratase PrpD